MASKKKQPVLYRRKREGKTDYKKRLRLLISNKPRLIIRRTSSRIIVQIAAYEHDGDKIIASADSGELRKLGWKFSGKCVPAAYLTGLLLSNKAKDKNIGEAITDIGLQTPIAGTRIFAALKGVIDGKIDIPHSKDVFPKEDRISGKHISSYAGSLKGSGAGKQFSGYRKSGTDAEDITKAFEDIRTRLAKGAAPAKGE